MLKDPATADVVFAEHLSELLDGDRAGRPSDP
jgi:hypothetical protein